jgi:APA family basic amino acid/polyamine antiporter
MATKQTLTKGISFYGFLALGIGCVFGASWLVLTGAWLTTSGGPSNALIAMLICTIMEVPFALAYLEAVPMIPLAGGEIAYSFLAFGSLLAFIAGWFGVLAMIALCAWESLAITKMAGYLIPSIANMPPLYSVGGFGVTTPLLILGLVLIVAVGYMGYKGVKLSARFQMVVTYANLGLVFIAALLLVPHFRMVNFQPITVKPIFTGVVGILTILPFSIAGWEAIAKGAEEASEGLGRAAVGKAVILSLIIGALFYMLTVFVPAGIVPWQTLLKGDIPFATAANLVTGSQVLGFVLVIAALFGVLSVYNSCFYAATRLLYSMGDVGLIPTAFARLHPKFNTPIVAVIFVSGLSAIAPFVGQSAFMPLVDCISFSFIALWTTTLVSVMRLRKTQPKLNRPVRMPAVNVIGTLGIIVTVLMMIALLDPASPGALVWPVEYILLVALIVLGIILYALRPKEMSEQEQGEMILGDVARFISS